MTDPTPTLTDLREIAECIAEAFAGDRRPLYRDAAQLAADYLRLTDPTPLTAEHCREVGDFLDLGDGFVGNGITVWTGNTDHPDAIRIEPPTVGQLRLALLQENRDGE